MNILNHLLDKSAEFKKITAAFEKNAFPIGISGAADAQKAHLVSELCEHENRSAFIITHSEQAAKRLYEDLRFFSERGCIYVPPRDIVLYEVEAADRKADNDRAYALSRLDGTAIGIASVESFMQTVPDAENLSSLRFVLREGGKADLSELSERLVKIGYTRVITVDSPGQFAIRGGIADIFPPGADNGIRAEFFGDDIDSVRSFDCDTQLSIKRLEEAEIIPVRTAAEASSLFSYIPKDTIIFFDEPLRIGEAAKAVEWEIGENIKTLAEKNVEIKNEKPINTYAEIMAEAEKRSLVGISSLSAVFPDMPLRTDLSVTAKGMGGYGGNIEFLVEDLRRWLSEKYRIAILGGSSSRAAKIREMLTAYEIKCIFAPQAEELSDEYITVVSGSITHGFEYPLEKVIVISDKEIFAEEKKRRSRTSIHDDNIAKIKSVDKLEPGDLVVHRAHGIGKYLGIVSMKVKGVSKDYIKIAYRGEDFLYLPVGQLDAVSKYTGGSENSIVRLNKLGSNEWANARKKVKSSVREMAQRLVALYAEREKLRGVAFSPDTPWQHKFEDSFPYEETDDQLRSIEEMKHDMESERPMDRLLCGDVGYGKTEVAMRGAFKAVMDGYQVAYLVPTTILAAQHYNNFAERMKDFPITVRMLSRFCTPGESKRTLEMLRKGECDIVVGTHKLLSKNVIFKKLGFLIIDEEQRFGVTHKEKIKEMKKNVDVLTLSATPIPRTLHMAMIGIRDMSVLSAPPSDRYPVQTYVLEYNEAIIGNAVSRELARGGQVYYLHNRVETIFKAADRIAAMFPSARIGVAHGRMSETELENVMMKTDAGEIDILVCTTIIETGLDIPNVNTIIIENADNLGLSQLYQLRGRVGRTNRLAYAYLTYRRNKILDETAEKRLRAIREFTEFGAGFRIALRDLEIRGAGNVLGPEQHGFMASVGYDMYCSILEEAVNEAMGKPPEKKVDETVIDLNVSAFIPDSYIQTSALRIEAYKKIAAVEDLQDRYRVEEEFEDRYGDIPKETVTLMDIQMTRIRAHDAGITEISQTDTGIVFKLSETSAETAQRVSALAAQNRGKILFGAGDNPYILLREKSLPQSNLVPRVNEIIDGLGEQTK